jgi:hypothetical protein
MAPCNAIRKCRLYVWTCRPYCRIKFLRSIYQTTRCHIAGDRNCCLHCRDIEKKEYLFAIYRHLTMLSKAQINVRMIVNCKWLGSGRCPVRGSLLVIETEKKTKELKQGSRCRVLDANWYLSFYARYEGPWGIGGIDPLILNLRTTYRFNLIERALCTHWIAVRVEYTPVPPLSDLELRFILCLSPSSTHPGALW